MGFENLAKLIIDETTSVIVRQNIDVKLIQTSEGEGSRSQQVPASEVEIMGSNESPEQQQEKEKLESAGTGESDEGILDDIKNIKNSEELNEELKEILDEIDSEIRVTGQGSKSDRSSSSAIRKLGSKASNKYTPLLRQLTRWIQLLRGREVDKLRHASDVFSRRVPGALGREVDEVTIDNSIKSLILCFDTSGSMNKPMLTTISSDLSFKLAKSKIINKVIALNIDGRTPYKFSLIKNIKSVLLPALRGMGSDFTPVWKQLEKIVKDPKNKKLTIKGIVFFSDLAVNGLKIPNIFRVGKEKVPILYIQITPSGGERDIQEAIHSNSGYPLSIIKVINTQVSLPTPMRVK